MNSRINRMDWASVSRRERGLLCERTRSRPAWPLAGLRRRCWHRCRMVRVTVGRSGDKLVRKIEASERVHRRHFEGVGYIEIREQAGDSFSEHGLANPWRAMEEQVMPTCCGYFAGPLGLDLTHYICQVEATVGMATGPLSDYLDGVDLWHRHAAQKGDQLGDRGDPEDLDSFNELRLSGLPQRHDHPGEACLLSRQSGGQNPADGPETTIQPKLTQKDCSAQLFGSEDALRREHRRDDRDVKPRIKPYLEQPKAALPA